jgi:hypothetical protein
MGVKHGLSTKRRNMIEGEESGGEVTGELRKLHKEGLRNLYSSFYIVWMIKSM